MSLLWPTLSQARTIVCHDIEAEGWDLSHLPHSRGLRSVAAVPLRAGDTVVGSLLVTSDQPHAFSARSVARLEILTESLGTMVQLRQVASKLHASELQYRMLFDEHPHPMWVYESDSLRLLAVNRAMVAHYGYTEAELLQMELPDLCTTEDRPGLRERLKDVFQLPRDALHGAPPSPQERCLMHMEISAGKHQLQRGAGPPGAGHRHHRAPAHRRRPAPHGPGPAPAERLQRGPGARHLRDRFAAGNLPDRRGHWRLPHGLGGLCAQ
jgi:PAS domain-containing protein